LVVSEARQCARNHITEEERARLAANQNNGSSQPCTMAQEKCRDDRKNHAEDREAWLVALRKLGP
jgi:hypothetical protein